ncbi:MAG: HTTM domain-containing protein [Rhodobacteraceae bacterium]|nr:HTTM domain-containing protein [Paracoccaceae bacterium]
MSLDQAMRLTEIMLALAFLQQSVEHLIAGRREIMLFAPRMALCVLLLIGVQAPLVCLGLSALALAILKRFNGPYNGGSDRMSLLILFSLTLAEFMPNQRLQEYVFGYLALQLVLSYFISGYVKVVNPQWRSGRALQDVFEFSAYPVSEGLRQWAKHPRILWAASWGVISFELVFPLTIFSQPGLIIGLIVAGSFHFSNACFFGLNRFFWIWLCAYPSILWLQDRAFVFA